MLRITVFLLVVLFVGCKAPKVDTLPCDIVRFDQILFALDHANPEIDEVDPEYYSFFNFYAKDVLRLGTLSDPEFPNLLSYFLTDSVMNEIHDTVAIQYPNMIRQEKDFSEAFANYKHYFPEKQVPQIYTHISGLNQSVVVDENMIGIGLDNYLGEDCIFYKMLMTPIPLYIQKKMTADHIVRDVMFGWLSSEFVYRPLKNDLLSGLIYNGKITYLMEKILPGYSQERIFNYQKDQLKWCKNNEQSMWEFLIDQEYLFSTGQMLLIKYLNEAPFTSGMPTESPGRAVVWNGYQIVKRYMKNTDVSLDELMREQDYHKILRLAKYRP